MRLSADLKPQSFAEPNASTAIWFTQLRWVAIAGQLLAIGFVWLVLAIELPITPLLCLVLCTAISNIALWWMARSSSAATGHRSHDNPPVDPIDSKWLGSVLLFDVATLTGLLYCTGGAANPFIFFYFANIAVAGVILSRFWVFIVTSASVVGGAWLLENAIAIGVFAGSPLVHDSPWGVTKLAFLIAFATCCGVLAYFVSMLALEVRQRDRRLAISEKDRERSQRLEALATLAAGAGHELASPLSTIAVIAGELSRTLEKHDMPDKVRRDFGLIREELNRCKEVLHRMKSGAGEAAAERLRPVTLSEILQESVLAMREPSRIAIEMEKAVGDYKAMLPKQALSQALRNLLQNGLDASLPNQSVRLHSTIVLAGEERRNWLIEISDSGMGLSDDVLRRIGEPFFTTKEVGEGMGLGVFLTRNVIHGLGGELKFTRSEPSGTQCTITLPLTT